MFFIIIKLLTILKLYRLGVFFYLVSRKMWQAELDINHPHSTYLQYWHPFLEPPLVKGSSEGFGNAFAKRYSDFSVVILIA